MADPEKSQDNNRYTDSELETDMKYCFRPLGSEDDALHGASPDLLSRLFATSYAPILRPWLPPP